MLNKMLSVLLIGLIANVTFTFGQSNDEKEAQRTAKVKTQIAKRGTGTKAKVKVQLKDKTVVKGYISEIKSDSFVVVNAKDGTSKEIRYEQVQRASKPTSSFAILGIAAGIGAVIILVVAGRQ